MGNSVCWDRGGGRNMYEFTVLTAPFCCKSKASLKTKITKHIKKKLPKSRVNWDS